MARIPGHPTGVGVMFRSRMIFFTAMALATGELVGCAHAMQRTLTELDAGTTVNVTLGEVIALRLPAQMGTGLRWIAQANPRVSMNEHALTATDKPGGTDLQVFEIVAVQVGVAQMVFEYRRSWMPAEPAAKRFVVTLDIAGH